MLPDVVVNNHHYSLSHYIIMFPIEKKVELWSLWWFLNLVVCLFHYPNWITSVLVIILVFTKLFIAIVVHSLMSLKCNRNMAYASFWIKQLSKSFQYTFWWKNKCNWYVAFKKVNRENMPLRYCFSAVYRVFWTRDTQNIFVKLIVKTWR